MKDDDEVKVKEFAVENVNAPGRLRVIEVYRESNAKIIADSADEIFKARGDMTRSEVVRIARA